MHAKVKQFHTVCPVTVIIQPKLISSLLTSGQTVSTRGNLSSSRRCRMNQIRVIMNEVVDTNSTQPPPHGDQWPPSEQANVSKQNSYSTQQTCTCQLFIQCNWKTLHEISATFYPRHRHPLLAIKTYNVHFVLLNCISFLHLHGYFLCFVFILVHIVGTYDPRWIADGPKICYW